MTEFKPEGLKVPDCACFKTKLKAMNAAIDFSSAFALVLAGSDFTRLNICDTARDYFYARFIWLFVCACFPRDTEGLQFGDKMEEFEKTWERLKPLVFQCNDYADGRMMETGEKE